MIEERINKESRRRRIASQVTSLLVIFIFILATSVFQIYASYRTESTGFAVELKEWLILEVSTPEGIYRSEGSSECSVTTKLNPENYIVEIDVLLSIAHNQTVHLRVRALDDLVNSKGKTFPVSNIAWRGMGVGFIDGVLDKHESRIMATWTGPGRYHGTVSYHFIKPPEQGEEYTQTVRYWLMMP